MALFSPSPPSPKIRLRAPKGFAWKRIDSIKASFLVPEGGTSRRRRRTARARFFITKEDIGKGGSFETGLSVNVQTLKKDPAQERAAAFIGEISRAGEVLESWGAETGVMKGYALRVRRVSPEHPPLIIEAARHREQPHEHAVPDLLREPGIVVGRRVEAGRADPGRPSCSTMSLTSASRAGLARPRAAASRPSTRDARGAILGRRIRSRNTITAARARSRLAQKRATSMRRLGDLVAPAPRRAAGGRARGRPRRTRSRPGRHCTVFGSTGAVPPFTPIDQT